MCLFWNNTKLDNRSGSDYPRDNPIRNENPVLTYGLINPKWDFFLFT